jgi:hypothetical protein
MPEGIIDITINPFTPLEVEQDQLGVDEHFYEKVRVPLEERVGVSWDVYVGKMDRAGVQRSLLCATRAGDMRMKHSTASSPRASVWSSSARSCPRRRSSSS